MNSVRDTQTASHGFQLQTMALEIESVNPPSAIHLNDGDDKSMMAGDLEDGEIPDEDGGGEEATVENEPEVTVASQKNSNKILTVQNENVTVDQKLEVSSPKLKNRTKNVSVRSHRQTDSAKESVFEDDWAGDVEKAIMAAMNSKEGQDSKVIANNSDTNNIEEDEERKSKRKKKKRKHRDDEDQRKESKKRKRARSSPKETDEVLENQFEEDDEDDDEMLYVRGASPVMHGGYGSPSQEYDESFGYADPDGPFDDAYDSFCDDSDYEQEDFEWSQGEDGPKRGGRGGKRQIRGGGRGLQIKRSGSKEIIGSKGKRLRIKRVQQRPSMLAQDTRQGPDSICMFFMKGKCQRGEECPYSHDAMPPRKMELCKFYLVDRCAKKDKCLYMHSDFPCKFFHTGLKCFAGDRCKFSHGMLTETLRTILLKHLESAPKEILGDFPRLSREGAAAMIYNKKNRNKGADPNAKKIPSLFEIEVPVPPQFMLNNLRREEERSPARQGTPMPESDNEAEHEGNWTAKTSSPRLEARNRIKDFSGRISNKEWENEDSVSHDNSGDEEIRPREQISRGGADTTRESSKKRESGRWQNYEDQDFSDALQQLKLQFFRERQKKDKANNSADGKRRRHHHKTNASDEEQPADDGNKQKSHHKGGRSSDHEVDPEERNLSSVRKSKSLSIESEDLGDDEGKLEIDIQHDENEQNVEDEKDNTHCDTPPPPSISDDKTDKSDLDHNISNSMEAEGLPLNLPKKQRELFLRLKNKEQQREAVDTSSRDNSNDKSDKDADVEQQEENWYSSDEEESSLTDVLKNLSKQQHQAKSPPRASTTPPLPAPAPASIDNIKLSDINISESVSKLLSSIRQQQQTATNTNSEKNTSWTSTQPQPTVVPTTQARDPRLMSHDARNRTASSSKSPLLSPSSSHHDPRTYKRSSSTHERSESHRTSIYSSAITSANIISNSSHSSQSRRNDVDLRNFVVNQQAGESGLDLQNVKGSPFNYGDTDLRGTRADGILGLPFKPIPMHTPATEIDASYSSHPPIPYKVVPITIPWPDYSGLKLNVIDPQVRNDPRLCKLLKLSSPSSAKRRNSIESPASPSPPPQGQIVKQSPPTVARNDPRRRSAPVTTHPTNPRLQEPMPTYPEPVMPQNQAELMQNMGMPTVILPNMPPSEPSYDPRLPRNPRNAPGLLGPAPIGMMNPGMNFCPNMGRFDEQDNMNGPENIHNMFYGVRLRNTVPNMEMQQMPQNQNHPHRNRNWRNNRHNQQQFQQERSFTPPL